MELKPGLGDAAKTNKWCCSGSMMGPQLEPYYSKKAPTGADISAGPDREHSFAPRRRGDFEVVGAEVKRAAPASTPHVYLAALALRELLMNDEDGWTSRPKARRHARTHADTLASQREGREIYSYVTLKVAVGMFSSMCSVSALAVNRELSGARLALAGSRCHE